MKKLLVIFASFLAAAALLADMQVSGVLTFSQAGGGSDAVGTNLQVHAALTTGAHGGVAAGTNGTVTYTGTTIRSDANVARSFKVTLTNNATMLVPTNALDGQVFQWTFIQGAGAPYTLWAETNGTHHVFFYPSGATNLQMCTNVNSRNIIRGVYDSAFSNFYFTGNLLFESP